MAFYFYSRRVAFRIRAAVMLVAGQGVFAAIGRSASLASGNVKRLAALFVFTTVAAYSALLLLYVPLAWYAWANGVEFFIFDADMIPAWYEIANQVISQASLILLLPVWMIGLCLLYVDERVRHEGYDIELMAAQRLGEIPAVPNSFINPLQPALASQIAPVQVSNQKPAHHLSTLGLESPRDINQMLEIQMTHRKPREQTDFSPADIVCDAVCFVSVFTRFRQKSE